jgi:hypothetical protein
VPGRSTGPGAGSPGEQRFAPPGRAPGYQAGPSASRPSVPNAGPNPAFGSTRSRAAQPASSGQLAGTHASPAAEAGQRSDGHSASASRDSGSGRNHGSGHEPDRFHNRHRDRRPVDQPSDPGLLDALSPVIDLG